MIHKGPIGKFLNMGQDPDDSSLETRPGPPPDDPPIVQALSGVGLVIGFIAGYMYSGNFGWALIFAIGGAGIPVVVMMLIQFAAVLFMMAIGLGLFFGVIWAIAYLVGAT